MGSIASSNGLGFAIPRNVRWCVISDLEQKKCNDLTTTCNVPEVSLVCVHKASTEDCMSAIKDGQADAMFLDGGQMYKASRKPYNLKPIIAEPSGAHKVHSEVPNCLKERQKALGDGTPMKGAFIPDCDEKGDYKPQQCHGSTGYCWCVNPKGEEVAGTKTPPGTPRVPCQDHIHSEVPNCLKERQKALGDGTPMKGAFIPDCNEKGDYKPQQCHGSTGYCWCVNPKGEEVAGTKTPPGTPRVPCQDHSSIEVPKCLKERQKALEVKRPMLGAYIPDCDEKGEYKSQQCHGSTGHCWCVNANGEEIPGTKTAPTEQHAACEDHNLPKCLKDRKKALGVGQPKVGAYLPDCDEKGDYKPQQCHGSTGHCWCVKPNGEEIPGTKTPPGAPRVPCDDNKSKCQKERQKVLGNVRRMVGAYVPDCDEKGDYKSQQCHFSAGYCWCVKPDGEEIPGTKNTPGAPPVSCEDPNLSKCLKERKTASGDGQPRPGYFTPECDEKGDYKPQQCHGSTGHCWCVNANGEQIMGTRTSPTEPRVSCENRKEPKCLKELQRAQGAGKGKLGAFIPKCTKNGEFEPQQCRGSTGYCWCVNANGEEIPDTKTPPGTPRVPCEDHNLSKCQRERQNVEKEPKSKFGVYTPECDEKGNYKTKQCHPSSGYCWNVDQNGDEIAATPPGYQQDSETSHYAVAVVKASSSFNFDELKGKKSCHSGRFRDGGWYAPLSVLREKKMLLRDDPAAEPTETALSGIFSASCIPGASQAKLCSQCSGTGGKRCKSSHDEPYYGSYGALRCLEEHGDVAFIESTALPGADPKKHQLLCRDNTRKSLTEYKNCNLGRLPADAVVTREAGDKTKDITDFLMEAQKKQCKLFDSTHGKDLIFEDSITSLTPLHPETNAFVFLGDKWFHAMKAIEEQPQSKNTVRWCTIGRAEKEKCDNWSAVSGKAISCTEATSTEKCIKQVLESEADAVSVEIHNMYSPLKCGLVPAMEEYYNKNDLGPCKVRGSTSTEYVTRFNVALVKKSNTDINWDNLKGKKSCHAGTDHVNSWTTTVSYISRLHDSCDLSSYFGESCIPGSDPNSSLCRLCKGDPNSKSKTKCSASSSEAYYGNKGAFRCLVEKGDIAFVDQNAALENTDGKNTDDWAKNLKSTDYELLCPDGSRAPITSYRTCNLFGMAPRVIVTREESVSDVVRVLINQESLYGINGFEKDMFQLFSSKKGKNLLFDDETQCLFEFDRQPRGIFHDLFGIKYRNSPYIPNKCVSPGLASVCASQHS